MVFYNGRYRGQVRMIVDGWDDVNRRPDVVVVYRAGCLEWVRGEGGPVLRSRLVTVNTPMWGCTLVCPD